MNEKNKGFFSKLNTAEKIIVVGTLLALISFSFVFVNIYFLKQEIASLTQEVNSKIEKPNVSVIVLLSEKCQECDNKINSIISELGNYYIEIKEVRNVDYSSDEGKDIARNLQIKRLPAVIVESDKNDIEIRGFNKKNGFFVYEADFLPYFDIEENSVKGSVNAIVVFNSDCKDCYAIDSLIDAFKQNFSVYFSNVEKLDFKEEKGKNIVNEFSIKRLPAIIFSKDIEAYNNVLQLMQDLGFRNVNNKYVFDGILAYPYYDIDENSIRGVINAVIVEHENCEECVDFSRIIDALRANGLFIKDVNVFVHVKDEQANKIIEKYKISKLPTFLLFGDFLAYNNLLESFESLGNTYDNNTFVFNNYSIFGFDTKFFDVNSKKITTLRELLPKQEVTIKLSEFSFEPKTIRVKKGTLLNVNLINEGTVPHDFVIDELNVRSEVLQPGQQQTVEFVVDKEGVFNIEFYCSLPGHKERGMIGTLVVE